MRCDIKKDCYIKSKKNHSSKYFKSLYVKYIVKCLNLKITTVQLPESNAKILLLSLISIFLGHIEFNFNICLCHKILKRYKKLQLQFLIVSSTPIICTVNTY